LGKEELLPFLARRMLFCPGREPFGHKGSLLFPELIENTDYLEKERLFFSTKLEMNHIFLYIKFLCVLRELCGELIFS
jgi:hypothetical protein